MSSSSCAFILVSAGKFLGRPYPPQGGGDDGEPPTSQTRANLPPLYKSPPEQSYLAGEGALTLSAPPSFHSLDTSTAAASIDRLSAMYRDVAA